MFTKPDIQVSASSVVCFDTMPSHPTSRSTERSQAEQRQNGDLCVMNERERRSCFYLFHRVFAGNGTAVL